MEKEPGAFSFDVGDDPHDDDEERREVGLHLPRRSLGGGDKCR